MSTTEEMLPSPSLDNVSTGLRPFLRWAGGKRQLLDRLHTIFPKDFNLCKNSFYEPFIGGGALTFSLASGQFGPARSAYLRRNQIVIGDQNHELVNVYTSIRDEIDELIKLLKSSKFKIDEKTYYKIRNSKYDPKSIEAAARFIYLNRLCFNGLYRVNSQGKFNVPYGRITSPTICDEPLLRSASNFLNSVDIIKGSFEDTTSSASVGDLVYFDPPYIPTSPTASFTRYSSEDFTEYDHHELMDCIDNLTNRGVNVILSNSFTEKTCEIYGSGGLTLYSLSANRSIAASGISRQKTSEILGVSFPINPNSEIRRLQFRR